jgi:universal stress protein A
MTTPSKILLAVSITSLIGGIMIDHQGVGTNPWLAAVMPLGAVAFGLFLIVFTMEKEVASYEQEQAKKSQHAQRAVAAPDYREIATVRAEEKSATTRSKLLGEKFMENVECHAGPHSKIAEAPPQNPSRILVPIDFSDSSKKALQYAVHFAKQLNASIVLMHVLPPPFPMDDQYEDESARKLRAWADEFVPDNILSQIETRHGVESLEILDAAKKLAASLMIISTHGRTGRAHALAGSLAENLVQFAPCPILVVREHELDFIEATVEREKKQADDFIAMGL